MRKLASKYDHQVVEAGRYQAWLAADSFRPRSGSPAKPYALVLPPPNVTGKLHLGHAWDTTLQDIIVRQKRMQGYDVLWVPGMDHAGIATQARVEAELRKHGQTRYDLGRKAFVDKVWQWKDTYAQTIHQQWAKLGLSLNYSRERFTLDAGASAAVRRVFVHLYQQGLIYRGKYIINWDPQARTALSDIEVIHQDDPGAFYHITYAFADPQQTFRGQHAVTVATTRPETLMGDTALAVNPDDQRYRELVGQRVVVPLANREIPIIADHYVDPRFGTGVVKITPAHDPNDFLVGNRHHLARINTMNDDGTMNANAGKYAGMDRFVARQAMVTDLKRAGALIKVDPIIHAVGHSERTGVPVEPRLSTQWFVKMGPLARAAIDHQQGPDAVDFVPARFGQAYLQWMGNLHDWVISRQLWWGHRIPAWYHKRTGKVYVGETAPRDPENWEQDSDVLDTWFSSALWPFTALGWPDTTQPDYQRYFPLATLVTGYDIIPFWVSRMIFQSLAFTGKSPFKRVLIHGLMRDTQGVKMSKSLGNGIDPMTLINQYGADALRWYLATNSVNGQDLRFSQEKLKAAWNFVNKLWNASRFICQQGTASTQPVVDVPEDLVDRWILSRLNQTVAQVNAQSQQFAFNQAGQTLYTFVWHDFCDWYLELSKPILKAGTAGQRAGKRKLLALVLDQILRLLHPFIPFVTETLWQALTDTQDTLVTAAYPVVNHKLIDQAAETAMTHLMHIIRAVRKIRLAAGTAASHPLAVQIRTTDPALQRIIAENKDLLQAVIHAQPLTVTATVVGPKLVRIVTIPLAEVRVPLGELVDLHQEAHRLINSVQTCQKELDRAKQRLSNAKFVAQAPANLVAAERTKVTTYQAELAATQTQLRAVQAAIGGK